MRLFRRKPSALQLEMESLRQKATSLFVHLQYMRDDEEAELNALYETTIGRYEYERFNAEIVNWRLNEEIKLVQIFINRHELIDQQMIDEEISVALRRYQKELKEREDRIAVAKEYMDASRMTVAQTQELRTLFRMATKALHPDLNTSVSPYMQELFVSAVSAYHEGDIDTMRHIVRMISEGKEAQLSRQEIRHLMDEARASIAIFQEKIDKMNARFPFTFREKLKDRDWVVEKQESLKEEIAALETKNTELHTYLTLLKQWKPDSLN